MTAPSSNSPQDTPDNFDTGPLSWVMVEIREALGRSKTALYEALVQDAESQATALRHAKTYLHQAHGALQIVDVDGVAIITETVEDLLERSESGKLILNEDIAQAISNAYQALLEYLDELLSGAPHQPVRLFPYYRSLLEARGAERIHPADLFFPNLAVRPQLPPLTPPDKPIEYLALRKRFERALLPFIKSTDRAAELANAALMRDLVDEVERAQSNHQSRGFWWVLHGFAEAVAAGQIKNELYVKQLFARINLQIRRLSEGSSSITERLLRDALFFIARAENPSPRVQQIRRAYQLDGVVPTDYEKKRYGQVDAEALAVAKERLSHAKNTWNRIAGGDASVVPMFESELNTLSEAGAKLNSPPLLKLLRELGGIARHAVHGKSSESMGLEMATGLLFVENALNHIGHLPDNFAERAEAMTSRLLTVVSGEQPAEVAQWLDDMSREAQQRQTMQVLAGELQTSLRQVEKMLEEYFNDPTQHATLSQIQSVLHQIGGALAILDQDDAMLAIEHTQETVRRFAEAGTDVVPDVAEFQQVARNIGALSFFIETLQLHSEGVKKRFSFDRELGVFHANLLEKHPVTRIDIDLAVESVSAPTVENTDSSPHFEAVADLPTVEDELALHQQHSVELAISLTAEPDNSVLQEQLKESLEQVRRDATLVDNPEANDRAQAAIQMLTHLDTAPSQVLAEIVTATAPVQLVPDVVAAPVAQTAPDSDEAVDAELLEIFLSEAEEVLGCVNETVPQSRNEPYNQDHLTTLRRSFHTLKGSGRMVGLMAFGEAAWSVEQVLNLRLSETRAGDADLYSLLDKAVEVLGSWVNDLQMFGRSARTPHALVEAAERVKAGAPFMFDSSNGASPSDAPEVPDAPVEVIAPPLLQPVEEPVVALSTPMAPDNIAEPEIAAEVETEFTPDLTAAPHAEESVSELPLLSSQAEEIQVSEDDMLALLGAEFAKPFSADAELDGGDFAAPLDDTYAVPMAEIIDFPEMSDSSAPQDDGVKHIGDLEISVPLHNIYLAETDELVRLLSQDIAEWRHELDRHVNVQAVHAAHSLAGSSATVGFKPLQEVAHALEMILQYLARKPVRLIEAEYDTLEHGIERIRFMLQMFALGEMPEHELEQVQILQRFPSEIEARLRITPELATISTPFVEPSLDEAPRVEPATQHAETIDEVAPTPELAPTVQFDSELANLEGPQFAQLSGNERDVETELEFETVEQVEPVVEAELESLPETSLLVALEAEAGLEPDTVLETEELFAVPETLEALLEQEVAPLPEPPAMAPPEEAQVPDQSVPALFHVAAIPPVESVFTHEDDVVVDPAALLLHKDELDADLLPIFLEEGRDMLPQMGQELRSWQKNPTDSATPHSILRILHTIKGSARMAGAMGLGQHMHDMETRIEQITRSGAPSAAAFEDILARHDQGLQLFEELQNPQVAASGSTLNAVKNLQAQTQGATGMNAPARGLVELTALMPLASPNFVTQRTISASKPSVPAISAPLVRVRADILDRLVNQAGEVSITRSKLETEVGTLRQSLTEMTENVARLRDQLREIEMQAETQITSRMAHSGDREFDPLEFDRFTRLQELTRMMAESVNDVGSVQQNLARTVDNASADLIAQARLTRDLQQDLMRVRMVQFASISERLYRVTRQTSKELDKRVNLDIRGSAVEIDRSVLEKMAGPFEHLLRNAIVHGIETRERRQAAGKSDIGELLVEIRQEGNEVVIQFSDDGQGLNLDNIRNKAKATGLLGGDEQLSDAAVTDLIFHSGFSTAEQVTELAGRGVGMDVVRSEATALGGRVAVVSEAGKGAHFTIHLPLTLAVTQVVVLTTGGKTYAVPSVLVEQVQQLKTNPLAAAYNDGAVLWQNQRVPLHYLAALLGNRDAAPVTQQYSPIIILKSGNDRVAIHVDDIVGNREVVVKNIGPQLARMIGIAGATVLGSGEIVLILNPVPLAQRFAQESVRAPRLTPADLPEGMGAVVNMVESPSATPATEPVQGLRTQHIVMVVDDSLTVRRVTQRLLAREGYQVVLAKDGVDALEHLQSITPDVMLVDIEMPRMDGFDLTRNVRNDDRTRHIPIIMITSRTATKHRNYAMELGVNEYLGKPYQEDALLKSIAEFINKEIPAPM
jgi:chemosensory pili system protein ChpA (sensor histidine kinase/response regulator)